MNKSKNPYHGHRFPPEVIGYAVWLYHRFTLSFRDIEEMLAIRGIQTSYESIRRWCMKFPQEYGKTLRKRQGKLGNIWYLDEVFLSIRGKRQYLWRAVDQDGDVIDILVQSRRNKGAARRFFKNLRTICSKTSAFRFHGSNSSTRLIGWPAMIFSTWFR